ncbi:hypothetical protein C8Q78DRAFT_504163 [Trametes maxima]|nr:hypothetical protein C8Q78DRAFT_504163 [Trametes maxima]
MSTAILESRPMPPHALRISRVASEPFPGQPSDVDRAPGSRITSSGVEDDPLITQLGKLASQHHASDYNRLKFGPNGSPLAYVPYSVQMPDHYRDMQTHQSLCEEQQAWWPCESEDPIEATSTQTIPSGSRVEADLREQLSAAMSSPLFVSRRPQVNSHGSTPEPQPHWQTSETHPIVISTIIPSELLPIVSSHLERCSEGSPVVFRLPRSHLLDRMAPRPPLEPPMPRAASVPLPPPVVPVLLPPCPPPHPSSAQTITRTLKLPNLFWVHPTVRRAFLGSPGAPRTNAGKRPRPASFAAPSVSTYPDQQNETPKRPAIARNTSSPSIPKAGPSSPVISTSLADHRLDTPPRLPHPLRQNPFTFSVTTLSVPDVPRIPPIGTIKLLGNLYLSSCPGKKVRLDGPVRGRGTVCRDLRSDLNRIKDVGVACIVCCLDDNELQSLGVTWEEYVQVANELGIDILRIPIPEGLPPSDPASLDSHLSKLIDAYTLHGRGILVHCRGGVGRAGLVACCWTLKLGLCGWLDTNDNDVSTGEDVDGDSDRPAAVDPETMRLVERLISVVRRRRSPKAIETYEQVRFLVDYIVFLRDHSKPAQPLSASLDWFPDWEVRIE